ncbi:MAG: hypothetical protein ACKVKM_06700 [Verrucomicrobiia bacterium]
MRAEERRAVIIFLMCILVVGNLAWLWIGPELFALRTQLENHDAELQREEMTQMTHRELEQMVDELNPKASMASGSEQATKVIETLRDEAERIGILGISLDSVRSSSRNNNPFIEHKRNATFETSLINLVEFLQAVADKKDSMIRVSDYKISPSGDRQRVRVQMSFIASYHNPEYGKKKPKKKKK